VFETPQPASSPPSRVHDGARVSEVETPMMQPIAGGAIARRRQRITTRSNMDLYLRHRTGAYLKRLTVGGFE